MDNDEGIEGLLGLESTRHQSIKIKWNDKTIPEWDIKIYAVPADLANIPRKVAYLDGKIKNLLLGDVNKNKDIRLSPFNPKDPRRICTQIQRTTKGTYRFMVSEITDPNQESLAIDKIITIKNTLEKMFRKEVPF